MNLSISVSYYINKLQTDNEKELLLYYYDNFNNNIELSNKLINNKKELLKVINLYTENNPLIDIKYLINKIENNINQYELNAIEYKNMFKETLFILLNKK